MLARRVSQFPRASSAKLVAGDVTEIQLPDAGSVLDIIIDKIDPADYLAKTPVPHDIYEAVRDAFLDASELRAPDGETEEDSATRVAVSTAAAGDVINDIALFLSKLFFTEAVPDIIDIAAGETQIACEDALGIEHAKVLQLTRQLNEIAKARGRTSSNKLGALELFEKNRYEKYLLAVEATLEKIHISKARVSVLKQLQEDIQGEDRDKLEIIDSLVEGGGDTPASDGDRRKLFAALRDPERLERRQDMELITSEIKSLAEAIANEKESIKGLIAEYYPSPNSEWVGGESVLSTMTSSTKDFKIDKALNLTGKPSTTTGDRWINLVSLFVLINGSQQFALLAPIMRMARQRTSTGVHYQPPTMAEWQQDPALLENPDDFHECKLVFTKQEYTSQNSTMFIKVASTTEGDDAVQLAVSGTISTQAGSKRPTKPVRDGDFVSFSSYFTQYHYQQSMVDMHLLTQFFYYLPTAIQGVKDMGEVVRKYRRKQRDAVRIGLRIQYGGVILPAYLAALSRHPSFVDFLSDYNPKPDHVDEDDAIRIMDPFLCDMERGVNTLRDIRPPESTHKNGINRYEALLVDLGERDDINRRDPDDHDPDVPLAAAAITDDFQHGKPQYEKLNVKCQGKPDGEACDRFVGPRSLRKMGLYDKAKAGETFPNILCDNCAMVMHNSPGGIQMKSGPNRTSNNKAGRKLIAQLGIAKTSNQKQKASVATQMEELQNQLSTLKVQLRERSSESDASGDTGSTASSASSSGQMVPLNLALEWRDRAQRQPATALTTPTFSSGMNSVLSPEEFHRIMSEE